MSPTAPKVVVQKSTKHSELPSDERIASWIAAAAGGALAGEITVRVVDEPESAELNQRYRGKPGATNVLAFAGSGGAPHVAEAESSAGDLVVCAPVVAREARAQGKSHEAHWAHIVIHGTLHLLGHDHERPRDARDMESRERELLASLGIGDPYAGRD